MKQGYLLIDAILAMLIVLVGIVMVWSITSLMLGQSDYALGMSRLNDFESYISQYIQRQGISASATSLEASTPTINAMFFGTSNGSTSYMRLVKITVMPTITSNLADITVRPVKYEIIAGNVKRIDTVVLQGRF